MPSFPQPVRLGISPEIFREVLRSYRRYLRLQSIEQDPHLVQELFHFLSKINQDRNYLSGRDRILGQVGVEEFCLVDHVPGMFDVGLQLLVEGEGEVELVQRFLVRLLLLS